MNKFFLYLWDRKIVLVVSSIVIFVWAVIYAFFIAIPEFKSEITFLPPYEGATSAITLMGMVLPGGTSIMYDQVEVIFNSAALRRRIIEKFNLYKLWKCENAPDRFEATLPKIKQYVMFQTKEKGGMGFEKIVSYTISCFHPTPDTAKLMCDYTFYLIDSSIKFLSTGMAHRNRQFVENQLIQHRRILDSIQIAFQRFQITNKAFVVPEQMRMSMQNYAAIKSAAVMNELKMKALQQEFNGTLPQLVELEKNDRLYREKLMDMETNTKLDVLPSLELSAKLLPIYSNLARETEVENQVIILLSREVEQARVAESRNVSLLTVIDPPFVPMHKARPKRTLTVLLIFMCLNFAVLVGFGYHYYYINFIRNNAWSLLFKPVFNRRK